MDEGVTTGHQPGKRPSIGNRRKQLDMGIVGDLAHDAGSLTAISDDDEANRSVKACGGDGVDDQRPAFFGAMSPDADEQCRFGRKRASGQDARPQPLVA